MKILHRVENGKNGTRYLFPENLSKTRTYKSDRKDQINCIIFLFIFVGQLNGAPLLLSFKKRRERGRGKVEP